MTETFERLNRIDPTIGLRSELEQLRQRAEAAEVRALQLEAELQAATAPPPEPPKPKELTHTQWAAQQVHHRTGSIEIDSRMHKLLMERSTKAKLPVSVFVQKLNEELIRTNSEFIFHWPGEDSGVDP